MNKFKIYNFSVLGAAALLAIFGVTIQYGATHKMESALANLQESQAMLDELEDSTSKILLLPLLYSSLGQSSHENNYYVNHDKLVETLKKESNTHKNADTINLAIQKFSNQLEFQMEIDKKIFDLARSDNFEAAKKLYYSLEAESSRNKINDNIKNLIQLHNEQINNINFEVALFSKWTQFLHIITLLLSGFLVYRSIQQQTNLNNHLNIFNHKLESLVTTRTKELDNAQSIAKIGSWNFNLVTGSLNWSSELYRIFEIIEPQSQDKLYNLYLQKIHPEDIQTLDHLINRAIEHGEDYVIDHRVSLDGGKRIKYVRGIGKVTKNEAGKTISLSGTCQDLTESKVTEIESTSILNTMSEGLVIQGHKGDIQKFNPGALLLLGLTADQLKGRTSMDPRWKAIKEDGSNFPGEEHPAIVALKTNKPVRNAIMGLTLPSGEERWIKINAIPFESPVERKVAVTFADITTILKKQKEIASLQEQNKLILASTGLGIWKLNIESNELEWDNSMHKLYGIVPEEFTGNFDFWKNTFSIENKQEAINEIEQALSGNKELDTIFEVNTKYGHKRYIASRATVIRNSSNKPTAMLGVSWDKTKEVLQGKSLKEALDFNDAIKQSAKFSIITTDLNGQITGFNLEAERILGYRAREIIGIKNLTHFHDLEEILSVANSISHEMKTQVPAGFETLVFKARKGNFDERKWNYLTKGGQKVPVTLNITGLYDSKNELYGFMGIAKDISHQVELEKSLALERTKSAQNAKLASLGEMAAGIAHEINNPLAIISGNILLLPKVKSDEEKFSAKLESLRKASDRIEKIVKGLKKFSRSSPNTELKNEILNEIVNEALVLTEAKAKRHSTPISVYLSPNLEILCDQVEIEQVLINLINNGIDAIKNSNERWLEIKGFEENNHVVLQIIDSGHGISEEVEKKLFEPFYTTKAVGEGTGLGLSIAKGILDNHKASFALNRNFTNTCFEIRFNNSKNSKVSNAV